MYGVNELLKMTPKQATTIDRPLRLSALSVFLPKPSGERLQVYTLIYLNNAVYKLI